MRLWREVGFVSVLGLCAALADAQDTKHAKLVVQKGPPVGMKGLVYSPDGRFFLTCEGKSALLFEAESGRELRTFEGHDGIVDAVAYSPGGLVVATGSEDEIARLWDVRTGKELKQFEGHFGPVEGVAFSSDGRKLLVGGGRTAALYEIASSRELRRFETVPGKVDSVALSKVGRSVVTGGGKKVTL